MTFKIPASQYLHNNNSLTYISSTLLFLVNINSPFHKKTAWVTAVKHVKKYLDNTYCSDYCYTARAQIMLGSKPNVVQSCSSQSSESSSSYNWTISKRHTKLTFIQLLPSHYVIDLRRVHLINSCVAIMQYIKRTRALIRYFTQSVHSITSL